MKDPKRYTLVQINDEHWMHENKNRMNAAPAGEYVLFDDYARLKAEVERLRASTTLTAVPVEEYEKLKAENERLTQEYSDATNHYNKLYNDSQAEVERLRKAGDGLGWAVHRLKERFWDADEEANKAIHDWNAAKDGKPSE